MAYLPLVWVFIACAPHMGSKDYTSDIPPHMPPKTFKAHIKPHTFVTVHSRSLTGNMGMLRVWRWTAPLIKSRRHVRIYIMEAYCLWGFAKIGVPFLGVLMIRGLYLGSPIFVNFHMYDKPGLE